MVFRLLESRGYHIIHESVLDQWAKRRYPEISSVKHLKLLLEEEEVDIRVDNRFMSIYSQCERFTMTSIERMYSIYKSIEYLVAADVIGSIVECGVWRGGSIMQAIYTLLELGVCDREIYLYDTFAGLPMPSKHDVDYAGEGALPRWKDNIGQGHNKWCYAPLEEVRENVLGTGYPENKIHFVKGNVEETLPRVLPGAISLLRLDTDFYLSTKQELLYLYPLLAQCGVLIVDDYGHWQGQKKAVDEFFMGQPILFNRIDHAARLLIKR
ncbi:MULTISPECIES: TylF/MycF/NovP-related O-methyltransferase [Aphanothece]|uniref:TylF/MycF/NovP-related O-methyltransferase n=1 Tax=Aphanothece TaxID=1121 RepID=UPI00398EC0B6